MKQTKEYKRLLTEQRRLQGAAAKIGKRIMKIQGQTLDNGQLQLNQAVRDFREQIERIQKESGTQTYSNLEFRHMITGFARDNQWLLHTVQQD
jgi:hypothetical protein